MREREGIISALLFLLIALSWLGFLFHRDPALPGSFLGFILGSTGAILMALPYLYFIVKRSSLVKRIVGPYISLSTLLTIHVYTGLLAPIFALLHTGHKFESPIGIALTAVMLLVVLSGVIGRYFMGFLAHSISEKKAMLDRFEQAYHVAALELQSDASSRSSLKVFSGPFARLFFLSASSADPGGDMPLVERVLRLSDSITDVEFSIKADALFRRSLATWLWVHTLLSAILLILLAGHIGSSLYFGLRWQM